MFDAASEDEDDEDPFEPTEATREKDQKAAESRRERQDKLREMMEVDEEGEYPPCERIISNNKFAHSKVDDVEMEDAISQPSKEATPEPEPEPESHDVKPDAGEPKTISTSENGRQRGRRQVIKKVTKKDDEGYLGMFPFLNMPICDSVPFEPSCWVFQSD